MINVREITANEWRDWRELRLQALAEAPYAFGSRLADWQGAGDTQQRWRGRLTDRSFDVIADLDGRPAGMASGFPAESSDGVAGGFAGENGDPDQTVELISMWVAPFARGEGVADALVRSVANWAARQGAVELRLRVMHDNARANAFYRRFGFIDRGLVEPPTEPIERWMSRATSP